jgi:hypothetical protein
MAESARHIENFVFVARETAPVRIAPGTAYAVTIDAELFTSPAVTTCTRERIEARLHAVHASTPRRREPPGWMRAPLRMIGSGETERGVAIGARALAMTGDAQAGLCARFDRVPRAETGSMQTGEAHFVELQPPRQRGNDPHAVTAGAMALAVTGRAEVARARRSDAVLALPIAAVYEMARRERIFFGEIDVAAVAVARPPLIFVLVASEAHRHFRAQRLRSFDADLHVAAHAVAVRGRHVRTVLESQVRARELGAATDVRLAVAVFAAARVVRLGVAAQTIGRTRKVQCPLVPRIGRPLMTRQAPDPFENVRPMLERVRRLSADAEDAGARREDQCHDEQEGRATVHGNSNVRPTRRRALTSN